MDSDRSGHRLPFPRGRLGHLQKLDQAAAKRAQT